MADASAEIHACPHCGTLVEGPEGRFCCHGCEAAAAILAEAGLSDWYASRAMPAPRVRGGESVAWDTLGSDRTDGSCEAHLSIDGLRCSSCVWVTEQVLTRTPGVLYAQVSYATGRAVVRWDPSRTGLGDIAARVSGLGYRPRPSGSAEGSDRDLLTRLGVAIFGALNVMGLSIALYAGWMDGMDPGLAQLFRWAALLVATPVVTWSAAPFFQGAWRALRHGLLHMDLPIALAVGAMYAHALWATVRHDDSYLDSLTMLVALLLVGRVLEARGRKRTADAAASLAAVVPGTARKVVGDGVAWVPTSTLAVGDRVDLASGDDVPADGIVVQGQALVRMAVLTGESRPVPVGVGDRMVAGAVVEQGAVRLGVTGSGGTTLVARLAEELTAAASAPRTPSAADRLAPLFTGATLAVAATTFLLVASQASLDAGLTRAVAVLVVACPCALALSGPLVGASGLGALARRGLLLRDTDTLDRMAGIDTVVLDKTGTITGGRPEVVSADDEVLRIAAGLERFSRHPIAQAILETAVARGLPIPSADEVVETAGQGIEGTLDGRRWRLASAGADGVTLSADDGFVGWIRLSDQPRAHAADDIRALTGAGLRVVMLTGDDADVAERIAGQVGVEEVLAHVGPRGKVEVIRRLQAEGRRVLFVGDGLNDAAALAAADVGIAMSSGAASSVLAADGVLAGERLAPLGSALAAAPGIRGRVRRNLQRSATYNVGAVAVAVLGWVNPLVAAVLMPLSSGLVLASAGGVERAVARGEAA